MYPERLAALPGPLFGALANTLRYGVGVSGDPEITQARGPLPPPATHLPAHDAQARQRLAHAACLLGTAAPAFSHTEAASEALPLALSSSVQSLSTHPPAAQMQAVFEALAALAKFHAVATAGGHPGLGPNNTGPGKPNNRVGWGRQPGLSRKGRMLVCGAAMLARPVALVGQPCLAVAESA